MPREKRPPFFVPGGSKDASFLQQISTESSDLYNREVRVKFLNREHTKYDALYGESKNEIYDDFYVRANVELTPKQARLTKMGIDEPRDLLVFLNVGVLKRGSGPTAEVGVGDICATEHGGYPIPTPGDLFIIEDEAYKILDQQKWDYNWHTEEHNSFAFSCERLRDRSVFDARQEDPETNPAGPMVFPIHTNTDFPGEDS
jgi:hypothetical protein